MNAEPDAASPPAPPRRTPNRRGQGGRLRAELIEAASQLLEELAGEEALSLRAVARLAGVAPQSVYLHFPDKRALLHAIYQARFDELRNQLHHAAAGKRTPTSRLLAICQAYCTYGVEHPGHYRVLFGTAGTPGWEPDQLPGRPTLELLTAALAACANGNSNSTLIRTHTIMLWAALHGLVTLRRDRPSFPWPSLDTLVKALVDTHIAALTSRSSPKR
jgi:AcrR family transcriptional regulator